MTSRTLRRALPLIAFALLAVASLSSSVPPVAATPAEVVEIAAVGDIARQSFSQGDGEGACRSDEVAARSPTSRPTGSSRSATSSTTRAHSTRSSASTTASSDI